MRTVSSGHAGDHGVGQLALQIAQGLVCHEGLFAVHQNCQLGRSAGTDQLGHQGLGTLRQGRGRHGHRFGVDLCLGQGECGQFRAVGCQKLDHIADHRIAGHAHIQGGCLVVGDVVGGRCPGVRCGLQVNARPGAVQLDFGRGCQCGQAPVVGGGGIHKHRTVGVDRAAECDRAQRSLHVSGAARIGKGQGLIHRIPDAGDVGHANKIEPVARLATGDFEGQGLHRAVEVLQHHLREQGGGYIRTPVVFGTRGQIAQGRGIVGGRDADGGGRYIAVQLAIVHVDAEYTCRGVGCVAQVGKGQAVEQGFVSGNVCLGTGTGYAEHHTGVHGIAGHRIGKSEAIGSDSSGAADHEVNGFVSGDDPVAGKHLARHTQAGQGGVVHIGQAGGAAHCKFDRIAAQLGTVGFRPAASGVCPTSRAVEVQCGRVVDRSQVDDDRGLDQRQACAVVTQRVGHADELEAQAGGAIPMVIRSGGVLQGVELGCGERGGTSHHCGAVVVGPAALAVAQVGDLDRIAAGNSVVAGRERHRRVFKAADRVDRRADQGHGLGG